MLRYAVAAATSLVLLTGLTACGGDPPPPRAQPSSTPTSPSSTPTPTPPALPATAKKNTKAGAKAFVRHYVDLINYAQATGRLSELKASESKLCESCKNGRDYLRKIYGTGGSIHGGAWEIRHIKAAPAPQVPGAWGVHLVVKFGPQTIQRPNHAKSQRLSGGSIPLDVTVVQFLRGWKVLQWTREA